MESEDVSQKRISVRKDSVFVAQEIMKTKRSVYLEPFLLEPKHHNCSKVTLICQQPWGKPMS